MHCFVITAFACLVVVYAYINLHNQPQGKRPYITSNAIRNGIEIYQISGKPKYHQDGVPISPEKYGNYKNIVRNIEKVSGHSEIRKRREICSNITSACSSPKFDEEMLKIYNTQLMFCPDVPLCKKISVALINFKSCCGHCSCSKECRTYKNCCPSVPGVEFKPYEDVGITCIKRVYSFGHFDEDITSFWMVSSCAEQNTNETLDKLCSLNDPPVHLEENLPVSPEYGTTTYRNNFCAECNNVTNYKYWNVEISCGDGKPFLATKIKEIENEIRKRKKCYLKFIPPDNVKPMVCEQRNIISTCNVSGLWKEKDELVERACHGYTSVYTNDKVYYQNIFCLMCNVGDTIIEPQDHFTCDSNNNKWMKSQSFSVLLDFSEDPGDANHFSEPMKCDRDAMLDMVTKTCIPVDCLWPMENINFTCVLKYKKVKGIGLNVTLRVKEDNITENCYGCCSNDLVLRMHQMSRLIKKHTTNITGLRTEALKVYYKSHVSQNGNSVLGNVEEFIVNFDVEFSEKSNMYKKVVSQLLTLDSTELTYEDKVTNKSLRLEIDGRTDLNVEVGKTGSVLDPVDGNIYFLCIDITTDNPGDMDRSSFLRLSDLLLCPYVNITKAVWSWKHKDGLLCFEQTDICLRASEYREENNRIILCKERYEEMVSVFLSNKNWIENIYKGSILSVICMTVSVVCLFFTSVTYCIFKVLRTLPGMNILALSLWMLVSFSLMLVVDTGIGPGGICSLIGCFLHFSWLCTFGWMNVCCIHIFKTFCKFNQKSSKIWRPFVIHNIYVLSIASTFVSINIVREVLSGAEDFGYDQTTCFISKSENNLLFFSLPFTLIFFINISLFIVVIVRIQRMPVVQKDMHHTRNNMFIFVKLSTFTGITWIFGFLYEFTKIEIFLYLFVIFVALQGLFVMLAFVFNKRVFKLYKTLCHGRDCNNAHTSNSKTLRSQSETRH